jgi:hypothetical protein
MSMRKKILVAALALGAISVPIVSEAKTIIVEVAPPPARVEVVPAARVGYVWAPGYWNWNGHRHVWIAGRWVGERHGYHWEAHRWEEHEGRWHFQEGGWRR